MSQAKKNFEIICAQFIMSPVCRFQVHIVHFAIHILMPRYWIRSRDCAFDLKRWKLIPSNKSFVFCKIKQNWKLRRNSHFDSLHDILFNVSKLRSINMCFHYTNRSTFCALYLVMFQDSNSSHSRLWPCAQFFSQLNIQQSPYSNKPFNVKKSYRSNANETVHSNFAAIVLNHFPFKCNPDG